MNGQLFVSRPARTILFVLIWATSAWFISDRIDRGWGPPDEGLLGQSAERFLGGEVPALDKHQVTVVAINQWTIFSGRPDSLMNAALEARYPHSTSAWHFTVRWSDPQ